VERAFAWLGNFRRLLVRRERVLSVYHGFFVLACVMIVLNQLLQWLGSVEIILDLVLYYLQT